MTGISSYYGISLDKESDITLTLAAVEHLKISNLIIPQQINSAYDDGSGVTQFQLANKGRAEARDIRISIEGDSLKTSEAYLIELLEPSDSRMVNLNMIAKEDGELSGNIQITYKTVDGETKLLEIPIQVKAEYHKAEIDHSITIPSGIIKEEPMIPDWVWATIWVGAVIVIGLLVKRLLLRKHALKNYK